MEYSSSKPGLSDKDAKLINNFIKRNFGKNVTAKQLLEAARSEHSPIHKYFEWDDTTAAERYRLTQARSLIVSIYVEADDGKPIRNFLRVRLDDGPTYLHHESVKDDQDLIDQVITQAHEQLLRWKERYGRYCEYFNLTIKLKGKEHVIEKEANN